MPSRLRGGWRRQRRAIAPLRRAGFVTGERFELHPGTASLLMQWEAERAPSSPGAATAMNGWSIALIALAVTAVATPVAIVVAGRTGIMDRPGALKPQAAPVPYLGGVAVFAGIVVGVLAGRPSVLVPLAAALLPRRGR